MTPFQKHKLRWQSCERCDLCQTRDKTCLVRGKLPADVLFIGEAPGPSEDVIGQPFIGPAGHLLDEIISEALNNAGHTVDTGGVTPNGRAIEEWVPADLRIAFTNLVACIPKSEDTGEKFTEPPEYAIKKCAPRLKEIVQISKPRLIVCVGKLSKAHIYGQAQFAEKGDWPSWLSEEKDQFLEFCEIVHPAAILRADVSQRSIAIKRCIVTLTDAFTKLVST